MEELPLFRRADVPRPLGDALKRHVALKAVSSIHTYL